MAAFVKEIENRQMKPGQVDPKESNRALEQEEEIVRIVRSHVREARLMRLNGVLHFEFAFLQGGLGNHKKAILEIKY